MNKDSKQGLDRFFSAALASGFLAAIAGSTTAFGQCVAPVEVQTVRPLQEQPDNRFGRSVDIDGDRMIVGAPYLINGTPSYGQGFIFERQGGTWTQASRIQYGSTSATTSSQGDLSGVAISGDWAVLAAYLDNNFPGARSGSVSLWQRVAGTWMYRETLGGISSDGQFGCSVSLDGDVLAVGQRAPFSGNQFAKVYRRNGTSWGLEANLQRLPLEGDGRFGHDVDVRGSILAVGEYLRDRSGGLTDAGACYIYEYNGTSWNLVLDLGSLVAPAAGDFFGYAVAIDGATCVVGAYGSDLAGLDTGAAYVFQRDAGGAWSHHGTLTAPGAAADDRFGFDVAISGEIIVVSRYRDDPGGVNNGGSAHLFRRIAGSWVDAGALVAPDVSADDGHGVSVAVQGMYAATGGFIDDVGSSNNAGTVRIFDLDPVGLAIIDQPDSVVAGPGESISFTTSVTGTAPISYRWRRDGVPLVDNYPFSGVTTPTLTINPTFIGFGGVFDCLISNICGSTVTTDPATLTVPTCEGDADGSRTVDFGDIGRVLANFGMICP